MIFFLLASICSLFSLVFALPVLSPVTRDVWVPPITSPDASTVWVAGCNFTVTWNASNPPSQVTNPDGVIYLRINGTTQLANPLAEGFPLSDGQVNVTVPADTAPSSQWVLVLIGDSGDWSLPFTILPSPSL